MRALFAFVACTISATVCADFDDLARYAFVTSQLQKTVIIVDLLEHVEAGEIELAGVPDGVMASEASKALIVSHGDARKLTLVDLTSDNLDLYDYPLEIRPDVVLVSPIGETVAIYDAERRALQVHALRRREILVSAEGVDTNTVMTFNHDGSSIYWVDQEAGVLQSVDLWSERRQLRLGPNGTRLSAMSRSIDGTLGFVSNADDGNVHVVDLRTLSLLKSTRVGGQPERPWGTADGQYMFVPDVSNSTLAMISVATGELLYTVGTVAHPVSVNPGWIDTVAAVVGLDGTVAFLRISDGRELARTKLDGVPEAGVVTSDSKTLAIPVSGSGSVAFFDMRKQAISSTITGLPRDIGPAALAVSNNLCH